MSFAKKPRVLVLHAAGTNRDPDACSALAMAGAEPEIVHINALRRKERRWEDYEMLVLPGGFSYADALGAGRLIALDLGAYFSDEVQAFVDAGKPVIGICNGFQALVRSGILPDGKVLKPGREEDGSSHGRRATLAHNELGRFECRWVSLAPVSRTCIWTRKLTAGVFCPVAHGEGRFTVASGTALDGLRANDQIALVYAKSDGSPAGGAYPENPNGSVADIAGICNAAGNVLGLMPHPENNIHPGRQPRLGQSAPMTGGLELFRSGVEYAAQR